MPKFLLHCCCAPCGIAVIDELRKAYTLSVFFYNPNIYPEEEYLKRKHEVIRVCQEWGVMMIDGDYEPTVWQKKVQGLETEPEGGLRCWECIALRLKRTAELAAEQKMDWFGTTLTMGRQKKSSLVTPLGEAAGRIAGVRYYAADWKKQGRESRARQMILERDIYRQTYCGCQYSLEKNLNLD